MSDEGFEPRYFLGRWPDGRLLYEDTRGYLGVLVFPRWRHHPIQRFKREWTYRREHRDWPRRPGGWG